MQNAAFAMRRTTWHAQRQHGDCPAEANPERAQPLSFVVPPLESMLGDLA